MKINLVENGIFPIIYNKNGEILKTDTGYKYPGTFQGEGKLLGTTCLFIRLSGCNLRCSWISSDGTGSTCDTPYSSFSPEKNKVDVDEIVEIIEKNSKPFNIKYIVISGGEPTLQTKGLEELIDKLQQYHVTIETNATIYTDKIAEAQLISMSPKLSNSTPWEENLKDTGFEFSEKWAKKHEKERKNLKVIQQYIDSCYDDKITEETKSLMWGDLVWEKDYTNRLLFKDFQLKFVVSSIKDIYEIENEFLQHLKGVNPDDVVIMPEGVTSEELMVRTKLIGQECVARGWRFTPRLHVLMFGNLKGV